MNKKKTFTTIAIISTIGIICWIITDYFGGMVIYLLSYGLIIIPIIILYIISVFNTFISTASQGFKANKIKLIFHGLVLLAIVLTNLYQSDVLKSKSILTATLKDDQFLYTLTLRENGNCENEVSGIFGFNEVYKGQYKFKGDTIIFTKKPYDNDFLPDTLLFDKKENVIFIKKDEKGNFSRTKEWLNHFVVRKKQPPT